MEEKRNAIKQKKRAACLNKSSKHSDLSKAIFTDA